MIILLDLNHTLVANSEEKATPFLRQIEGERYRTDLIDALFGLHVVLMTARPNKYRMETLHSIESKTGWHPDEAYFNLDGSPPPECKDRLLGAFLLGRFTPSAMLAIESNPATRRMYARHGIRAMTRDEYLAMV